MRGNIPKTVHVALSEVDKYVRRQVPTVFHFFLWYLVFSLNLMMDGIRK
jgi:hypothetical protein